tara:strand:+ start:2253 stop:3590 length:1338 start_codon:yes stop_codon:yes gene_type:complete
MSVSKHFSAFAQALAFSKAQPGSTLKSSDDGFIVTTRKGRAVVTEADQRVSRDVPLPSSGGYKYRSHHKACIAAQQRADHLASLSAEERRAELDAPLSTVGLTPEQERKVVAWGYALTYVTPDQDNRSWAVTDRPIDYKSVKFVGRKRVAPIPEVAPPEPIDLVRERLNRLIVERRNAPQGLQFPCPDLDRRIREAKLELQSFLRFDLVAAAVDGDIQAADRLLKNLVGLHESRVHEVLREVTQEHEEPQAADLSKAAYGKLARGGRIRCFSHKHAVRETVGRMTGIDPQTQTRHRSATWRSYTPPRFCVIAKHKKRGDWWVFEDKTIRHTSKAFEVNEIYRRDRSERGYWVEQMSTPVSIPTWSVEVMCSKQSIQTTTRAIDGERAGKKIIAALTSGDGNTPFVLGEIREADADTLSDITVEEWEAGFMTFAENEAEAEAAVAD